MPETRPLPNEEPASLIDARSVDRLCDRFEAAWRTGPPPTIEAFLADAPASARTAALRELIALEVEYRRRGGETPKPEDYETRFGGPSVLIASIFGRVPSRREEIASVELVSDTTHSSPTVELKEAETWPVPELPGYDILDRLGAGGMGVVYKARQHSLNRLVALKLIRPDVVVGPRERARFRREAEAAARLRHPHIVQVHEIGSHDEQPFAVLELVEGHTLAERVKAGPLPTREAATLVEKLARAVQHAHVSGILHRDLKPGNVLVTADGTPKVADFGLARWLGIPNDQTLSGQVIGTPSYMAPEQALGKLEQLSPATDVYALGAILYELLTGQVPFRGRTPLETLEQVKTHEPTSPSHLRRGVPRDLEAICLKCLAKEPILRYASAEALADDLKRWRTGEPTWARPLSWPARLSRQIRRHPLAATVALLFLASAIAIPITVYETNPLRAAESIERQLAAGQVVELVPEIGMPRFQRVRWADNQTKLGSAPDGTFEVNSWGHCLVELVRDPQITGYRIRAEIRQENATVGSYVGLFCGLEELPTARGPILSCGNLSFNDVISEPELVRNIPINAPGRPMPTGNPLFLRHLFLANYSDGSRREQLQNRETRLNAFRAAGFDTRWRSLTIEVGEHQVAGYWGDDSPPLTNTLNEWNKRLQEELKNDLPIQGMDKPRLAVRGGIGLLVIQCKASFRRVVVEPLGE